MPLQLAITKFSLKKMLSRQFIHLGIIVIVAVTTWMGILLSNAHAASAADFVTTWKTDNPGTSNSSSITIPTTASSGGVYNYDVDWNNDEVFEAQDIGFTGDATHDYGKPGTYTIRIRGTFPKILFATSGDAAKIININQWGTGVWANMTGAFKNAVNVKSTATDAPNLTAVTSTTFMFENATSFTGDLSAWNVSNVTSMAGMFSDARSFTSDLSSWNVSNVTDMTALFFKARSFTSNLSAWNVSKLTSMQNIFHEASLFNSDLSAWNVSSVTNMHSTFYRARSFSGDVSTWNVSNVTNMNRMFEGATSFDSDVSTWSVSNVTTMDRMFYGAAYFNGNISAWNISKVTDMWGMLGDIHLSQENYDAILAAWDTLPVQSNVYFSAGLSNYCSAIAARASLVKDNGWIIYDDGVCGSNNRAVSSVDFSEYMGSKIMSATGTAFLLDDSDVWTSSSMNSLVSLNGVDLPFCTDRTGSTAEYYIRTYGINPALVSNEAPCYYVDRADDYFVASATRFELLLPSYFNTSAPGTISINNSPVFVFNQPVPIVGGNQLAGTPTIDKRPTFSGKTVPESTVTVTVRSDPVVCTATANAQGDWSCTLPSDLPAGAHTATVVVKMPSGQTQTFGPYAVTVAAAIPTSSGSTRSGGSVASGGKITNRTQPLADTQPVSETGTTQPTPNTKTAVDTETETLPEATKTPSVWPAVAIGTLIVLTIATIALIVRRRFTRNA